MPGFVSGLGELRTSPVYIVLWGNLSRPQLTGICHGEGSGEGGGVASAPCIMALSTRT